MSAPAQADVIAVVGGAPPDPSEDRRARADTTLIAAAPDLLAACRQAHDWLDSFATHVPIHFGGEEALAAILDRVIGAAEGRESSERPRPHGQ